MSTPGPARSLSACRRGRPARATIRATALATALAGLLASPAAALAENVNREAVPLEKVVVFTSGVGYFQHGGEVEGDTTVQLDFQTDEINDLLKSMVVQDLSGAGGGSHSQLRLPRPDHQNPRLIRDRPNRRPLDRHAPGAAAG